MFETVISVWIKMTLFFVLSTSMLLYNHIGYITYFVINKKQLIFISHDSNLLSYYVNIAQNILNKYSVIILKS